MAWQLMIREGLSLSAMARLGELALALAAVPQTVRIVSGPPGPWLRLFTPEQQKVLATMHEPRYEPARVVWCGSGATTPRFPGEAGWCTLVEDAAALPASVADRYEQVLALVPGAEGKPRLTALYGVAQAPVLGNAPRTLLVIFSGRPLQDAAFVAQLQAAGADDVLVFDPYTAACHALERRKLYARCGAAASVDPTGDDFFFQEAEACGLSIFTGPAPRVAELWAAFKDAPRASLAPVDRPTWSEVARRWVDLSNHLSVPSGAQLQRLLTKMQGSARLPTILVKTPVRPTDTATSAAMVGFSVASDNICAGLSHQVEARFNLTWLLNAPDEVSRRRLYHYPYQRRVGVLGDEMDFAHLPAALRGRDIDLLCTTQGYTHGLSAARAAWATRAVPVVGMLHALHTSAMVSETLLNLMNGPSLPCDAWISPTACGVEAHQRLLAAAGAHLGRQMARPPKFAGSWHVIPYGIDRTPFAALHPQACRQALQLPQNTPVALSLGRFLRHEKADLMPLLLAWDAVVRVHPQALLLLAGSHDRGAYARQLRNICAEHGLQDNVRFFENVSTCDKHLLFGAADFFITVSDNLQETYGLTVIEAMATGLPVIATDWDGYRETVRHGETGFLVPTCMVATRDDEALLQRIAEGIMGAGHRDVHETVVVDVQALARDMRTLIDQPELRHRMGERARALCAECYDQDDRAQDMRNLFADCIRQARTTAWPEPHQQPFCDKISERFAHYPGDGFLRETRHVALTRQGADAAVRRRILHQAGWATPDVGRFTDELCQFIERSGGVTSIGAVLNSFPGDRYRHMLLIGRLLKYAILRFA